MLCLLGVLPTAAAPGDDDIVARARASYGQLTSYSDTGTIDTELKLGAGPTIREHHTFLTYFRKPRSFYFEFNEDSKAGADRFVVWSDAEAFKTWWKTTGVQTEYPRGQGVAALVSAFGTTNGAAAVIAPVLFPQADLRGVLVNFQDGKLEGADTIDGRKCHKVKGVQRSVYGTGRGESLRDTILWIDAETMLVRKMFEDTPRGTLAGSVNRVTTVFQPAANPSLDDKRFVFIAP